MFHETDIVMAALNHAFDRRRETGETVDERRDAPYRPARVSKIARQRAGVVVRKCDNLLRSNEIRGKKSRAAARGQKNQIHLCETGEVVKERSGSKCAAANEGIRRLGSEHQDLHVVGTYTG